MTEVITGRFVNVVASVDLAKGDGEIRYVNPSSVASRPAAAAEAGDTSLDKFELSIRDAQGRELRRLRPAVQVSSCAHEKEPKTGLISEDIPLLANMQSLVLLYDGEEVSRYEAGSLSPPERGDASAAGSKRRLLLDAPSQAKPNRRRLSAEGGVQPEQGISYTVQVKQSDAASWRTIAVSRPTPAIDIDRNQFPGEESVRVRILKSTGFDDEVFAEEDLDLRD